MDRNSKSAEHLLDAYAKGYRVVDGNVFTPGGRQLTLRVQRTRGRGYLDFSARLYSRAVSKHSHHICVHQLVAYQKFGDAVFEPGIVVRHLDGDCRNNLPDNIALGTDHDNYMDRPPEDRMQHACIAATHKRKFSDEQMEKIRAFFVEATAWDAEHRRRGSKTVPSAFERTMTEFGISSKGTMHHILQHDYKTRV